MIDDAKQVTYFATAESSVMLTRSTALGSDACIEMHREGGETVYVLNSAPHRHEPGQTCLAKEWAPPATLMQAIG